MASSITNSQLVLNGVTLTSGNSGTIAVTSQIPDTSNFVNSSQVSSMVNGLVNESLAAKYEFERAGTWSRTFTNKIGTILTIHATPSTYTLGIDEIINFTFSGQWVYLFVISDENNQSQFSGKGSSFRVNLGNSSGDNNYSTSGGGIFIRVN